MPYIEQSDRTNYDPAIDELINELRDSNSFSFDGLNPGHLNYIISRLCKGLLEIKGVNYRNINELIGALECAKLELYRRTAVPYENAKLSENGDI